MDPVRANISLTRIHCYDEGDFIGSAEPYLWTVFFKIDGETCRVIQVNSGFQLDGTSTVVGTPGNHGDLNNTDVNAGDDVEIPFSLGEFSTVLLPIPPQNLFPPIVGAVIVLMEQDNSPDSAVAKGHEALNDAVRQKLDELIPTLVMHQPTPEEINAIVNQIADAVKKTIFDESGGWLGFVFEQIFNPDDLIGVHHFLAKAQDLLATDGIDVGQRWHNEGDWEIFGQVVGNANPMWSGLEDLGGKMTAAPAVASWAANRLDCFILGTDKTLWHKWWDGSWSDWESFAGQLSSAPAAVSWGANRIDVFARGTNRTMLHKWWDGGWSDGWEDLGGSLSSAPAVCSWSSNRLDCFVRGEDQALWHKWWDAGWNDWEPLGAPPGGQLTSAPAAVSWGSGRIDVFARGTNDAMWHKWWDGSWSDWEDLGGTLRSAPAVASWAPNRLDCFVRGSTEGIWHKWWDGQNWSGWENLGGALTDAPSAVSWGPGRIDCFVRGTDDHMWHMWFG